MKDLIRKVIIALLGFLVSIATQVIVLIKGWGLEPLNWWYIVGVYALGTMLTAVILTLTKD